MYRLFASLVLATTLLLTTTYGGMAVFGMGTGTQMEHGSCVGESCHTEPGPGTAGMDCVDHCLSSIPVATSVTPLASMVMMCVVLRMLAEVFEAAVVGRLRHARSRWREGIRKRILKEALATVILRN